MTQHHPRSRRARALRALGIAASVVVAILAIPVLIVTTFANAKGERR